jgi:hypothetical protein
MTNLLRDSAFRTIRSALVQAKLLMIYPACQPILSLVLAACNGPRPLPMFALSVLYAAAIEPVANKTVPNKIVFMD